jgi:orotate phosphoribosyltransferase
MDQDAAKSELLKLLVRKSVCRGSFVLASGAKSDLYVDAKLTTLDPRGAVLVGRAGWALIQGTAAERGVRVDAVGGLTMGADSISLSIGIAAHLEDPACTLQTFTVRKTPKAHGRSKLIEGNFAPGNSVAVVEDVITSGGSALKAIDAIEAEGGRVAFVIALVDRQEGGRENIEKRGHAVVSIFTRADVMALAPPGPVAAA